MGLITEIRKLKKMFTLPKYEKTEYTNFERIAARAEMSVHVVLEKWEKTHKGVDTILAQSNSSVSKQVKAIMTKAEKETGVKLICVFRGVKDKKTGIYHPIVKVTNLSDVEIES